MSEMGDADQSREEDAEEETEDQVGAKMAGKWQMRMGFQVWRK